MRVSRFVAVALAPAALTALAVPPRAQQPAYDLLIRNARIVDLARVAGAMGGIHISHMREETSSVADSVAMMKTIRKRGIS